MVCWVTRFSCGDGLSASLDAWLHLGDALSGQEEVVEAAQRHSGTPPGCVHATASSGIDAGAALEHRSVPREVTSQNVGNVTHVYHILTARAMNLVVSVSIES